MQFVTSIKALNKLTVQVNFSGPDSLWMTYIENEPLGMVASPTAYNLKGATQFDLTPVGAGPFTLTQNILGQLIVLTKNPHFWDAKHVYLNTITYKATSTDVNAVYFDLESGVIDVDQFKATNTPPSIIDQALKNKNFATPRDEERQLPLRLVQHLQGARAKNQQAA